MTNTVIEFDNVWKSYVLGEFGIGSLQEDVRKFWNNLKGNNANQTVQGNFGLKRSGEIIWPLKGLSFTVEKGEIVGLVGRNGAGKSTTLKLLSQITTPTKGSISVTGKVSSLLEVGVGFHPELTGLENIYLTGTIFGLKKSEITRRLDEIIDFSGCEAYIDTPVKRYSSGMIIRLGFSVSVHLTCDIVLVDEVLSVGDHAFQSKCMDKLLSLARDEGRTIIFVSHNLNSVRRLCKSGLVLESGQGIYYPEIDSAVSSYLARDEGKYINSISYETHGTDPYVTAFSVRQVGADLIFEVECGNINAELPSLGVSIFDSRFHPVYGTNTQLHGLNFKKTSSSSNKTTCLLKSLPLHEGDYYASVWLGPDSRHYDVKEYALHFHFEPKTGLIIDPNNHFFGSINQLGFWERQ